MIRRSGITEKAKMPSSARRSIGVSRYLLRPAKRRPTSYSTLLSRKPNQGISPRRNTKCSSSALKASTTRRSSSRKSAPAGTTGTRASAFISR